MWYLIKKPEYLFKWEESANGTKVPYAVEINNCEASDGTVKYISKNIFGDSTTIGTVPIASGYNYFTDLDKNVKKSSKYTVLTCRSKVCKLNLKNLSF